MKIEAGRGVQIRNASVIDKGFQVEVKRGAPVWLEAGGYRLSK